MTGTMAFLFAAFVGYLLIQGNYTDNSALQQIAVHQGCVLEYHNRGELRSVGVTLVCEDAK